MGDERTGEKPARSTYVPWSAREGSLRRVTGRYEILFAPFGRTSGGLLDSRDEPRGLGVAGLALDVPGLVERLRVLRVVLADEAPEPHARDLLAVLDHCLDHVGVQRHDFGLLRTAAGLQLPKDFG